MFVQREQEGAQHTALRTARAECLCAGCMGPYPHCLQSVHQNAPDPNADEGWEVKVRQLPDENARQDGIEGRSEINKTCPDVTCPVSARGSQQCGEQCRLHQLLTYFPCRQN